MKRYESFLDRFKKDNKINQDIINEIDKYGLSLDFGYEDYFFIGADTPKILINFDEDNSMSRNLKKYSQQGSLSLDEIEYPKKGYIIELRFLDNAIEMLPKKSKKDFVFEFLENHSLENLDLNIWNYYIDISKNYYKIKINKKLADKILNIVPEIHHDYNLKKQTKKFKI